MLEWINNKFIPWMKSLKADHVVFIPGNHDLICTYSFFEKDLAEFINRYKCRDKIHYLNNSSIVLYGYKFFGIPNNESPSCWAFADQYNQVYEFDDDTDILITHQPPRIGNAGFTPLYNREFGSLELKNKILDSSILLNICGHVHTGDHGGINYILKNRSVAKIYNVSLLDEDYRVAYKPTIIEL